MREKDSGRRSARFSSVSKPGILASGSLGESLSWKLPCNSGITQPQLSTPLLIPQKDQGKRKKENEICVWKSPLPLGIDAFHCLWVRKGDGGGGKVEIGDIYNWV